MIKFFVHGIPAPQGSKNAIPLYGKNGFTGKVALVDNCKGLKPWRQAVCHYAREVLPETPLLGPVRFSVRFYIKRPKYHYWPVNSKHNGELRPDAPTFCDTKPDTDKLLRSTFDGITDATIIKDGVPISGIWKDDCQVADFGFLSKLYADGGTGAYIEIEEIKNDDNHILALADRRDTA